MKKGDTWMPLYVGDYLADTMHLTGPDHGAYLLLLMHSWRTGPLRDDERALAAVARTDPATFREMWPTLREFFVPQDGAPGFLISPRLERERERAAQHIDQRRAAGKASAEARARQRESNGRSTGVARPLEREGRPSPSPTYPSDTGAGEAAPAEQSSGDQLWQDGLPGLRDLTRKPDAACRRLIGRLRKAAGGDDRAVLDAIDAARAEAPADPVPWLFQAVAARAAPKPTAIEDTDWFRDLARRDQSSGRWVIGGFFLDDAIEIVRDAVGVPDGDPRDWEPLGRWLHAGRDLYDDILPVIRRMANRAGYRPPSSLRYFDNAVMGGGQRG